MVKIPIAPPNPFADPSTINLTANASVPATSRFAIDVVPDQAGWELTVSNEQTKFLFNGTAFDVTLVTTGNSNVTLGSGGSYYVMWEVLSRSHIVVNNAGGSSVQPYTFTQTALPADDSPSGGYSVQQGANRGLYMSNGVGAPVRIAHYPVDGDWPV